MAIQYREYWGTLSGNSSRLTTMRGVQEVLIDALNYGVSKNSLQNSLSGVSGVSGTVLQTLVGLTTVGSVANAFTGIVGAMNAEAKRNNLLIMTRGKYVFSELIAILNKNSNYRQIEAKVFFREYYNTATGERMRVVYGNSVPGDPKNNQQTGAFVVNRIQLSNGNWITG